MITGTTNIMGIRFILDDDRVIYEDRQYFFPRSKKRRIRNKCEKLWRIRIWRPDPALIRFGRNIVCHPETAKRVALFLQEDERRGGTHLQDLRASLAQGNT